MGLFDLGGMDFSTLMDPFSGGMPGMQAPDMLQPGKMMGTGNPTLPPMDPNASPISPEILAKNAAARGVPPPPVDFTPGSVGGALTGNTVPLPRERPPVMAQGGDAGSPMDITSQAQKDGVAADGKPQKGMMERVGEALKGVKMPANPETQRISSPAAPRPTTAIKGGDIVALLQSLAQARQGGGGLQLPGTLGAALRK